MFMLGNSLLSALRSIPLPQQQRGEQEQQPQQPRLRESKRANRSECRHKGEAKGAAAVCVAVCHCTYARVCVCVCTQGAKIHPMLPEQQQNVTQSLSLPTLFQPLSQSNDSSARTSTTTVLLSLCACVCMQGAKIHPKLPEPHIRKQKQFIKSFSLSLSAYALSLRLLLSPTLSHTPWKRLKRARELALPTSTTTATLPLSWCVCCGHDVLSLATLGSVWILCPKSALSASAAVTDGVRLNRLPRHRRHRSRCLRRCHQCVIFVIVFFFLERSPTLRGYKPCFFSNPAQCFLRFVSLSYQSAKREGERECREWKWENDSIHTEATHLARLGSVLSNTHNTVTAQRLSSLRLSLCISLCCLLLLQALRYVRRQVTCEK